MNVGWRQAADETIIILPKKEPANQLPSGGVGFSTLRNRAECKSPAVGEAT